MEYKYLHKQNNSIAENFIFNLESTNEEMEKMTVHGKNKRFTVYLKNTYINSSRSKNV